MIPPPPRNSPNTSARYVTDHTDRTSRSTAMKFLTDRCRGLTRRIRTWVRQAGAWAAPPGAPARRAAQGPPSWPATALPASCTSGGGPPRVCFQGTGGGKAHKYTAHTHTGNSVLFCKIRIFRFLQEFFLRLIFLKKNLIFFKKKRTAVAHAFAS